MMEIFEPCDLSVLDVENLRLHYARDAAALARRCTRRAADRVRAMFDAKFVRMWRLYLAGSIAAFTTGDAAAVPGAVRARPRTTTVPGRARDLYRD